MRPVSDEADAPQKDDMVRHGESCGAGDESHGEANPASDRRPESHVDTDDRTPEEAGYGYGV
jgi:hypothetical protein